jgi:hypothetical protein
MNEDCMRISVDQWLPVHQMICHAGATVGRESSTEVGQGFIVSFAMV